MIRQLALIAVIVASGCGGPKLYPVSGSVQFPDGVPVSGGVIECIPANGPSIQGAIDDRGQFTLSAPAGAHRFIIVQVGPVGVPSAVVRQHPHKDRNVASKYRDPDAAGLSYEVKSTGINQITFTVESGR